MNVEPNAKKSILVSPSGSFIVLRFIAPLKASLFIIFTVEGRDTSFKLRHDEKVYAGMTVSSLGSFTSSNIEFSKLRSSNSSELKVKSLVLNSCR